MLILHPVFPFEAAEEAALVAFVADAWAEGLRLDQHGIAVAIGKDLFDRETVSGAFAFEPQFLGNGSEGGKVSRFCRKALSFMKPTADPRVA